MKKLVTYMRYVWYRRLYLNCVIDYGLDEVVTRWARRRADREYRKYYSKERIEELNNNFY